MELGDHLLDLFWWFELISCILHFMNFLWFLWWQLFRFFRLIRFMRSFRSPNWSVQSPENLLTYHLFNLLFFLDAGHHYWHQLWALSTVGILLCYRHWLRNYIFLKLLGYAKTLLINIETSIDFYRELVSSHTTFSADTVLRDGGGGHLDMIRNVDHWCLNISKVFENSFLFDL